MGFLRSFHILPAVLINIYKAYMHDGVCLIRSPTYIVRVELPGNLSGHARAVAEIQVTLLAYAIGSRPFSFES